MNRNIVFKKTNQLSNSEKQQIIDLFFRVFKKKRDIPLFDRLFLNTYKGYSYHGLLLSNDAIVGTFNAIPYRYSYFHQDREFALSVDTMIDVEHRGGGGANLVRMAKLVYEAMIKDGIALILGFPNEYYYQHEKRILGTSDIGELDYYILLRNIGRVIPKLQLLNPLSRLFTKIVSSLPLLPIKTTCKHNIAKTVDDKFKSHRYDNSYSQINLGDGAKCIYKIYQEEGGIRALYIIDILPLTPRLFAKAVKKIYKATAKSIDVMLYVGKPPFRPFGLIKVPNSKKTQRIRMTAKILNPELVDNSIFEINNWNVNISNFDVR